MKGNSSETLQEIRKRVSQFDILAHYFNITSLPAIISSPFRKDIHPSFRIYTSDGETVKYRDLATGEFGDIYNLLQRYFNLSFTDAVRKVGSDSRFMQKSNIQTQIDRGVSYRRAHSSSDIKVKIRDWESYDIAYWESYGISLPWLKYAEVYPISHKIVYKDNKRYVFPAAKYAYCFVERKEDKVTLKVYQPLSKLYKWATKNDGSVVGLWTKIPKKGNKLVICSSLKDALCLWANTGIPAVYMQSETTMMSETAQEVLKSRFKNIYVLFDNDEPGIKDGEEFSAATGFKNIILPHFEGGKDLSDYFKLYGKERFIETVKPLFDGRKQKSQECQSL